MTEATDRLSTALADRYRLERHIGEGGMANVYLAHDLKHDRRVAVKVLRPELSAILGGERFVNEIKVTANLQHPHILPLYDSGVADTFLYYVMPYVEGESLRDRLNREKQLSVDDALKITDAVAGALQYAHEQGIVHRDIKPENILLQRGQPLVADFGIALAVSHAGGSRLTETGLSLGTPHYMSPEQATGDRELDARSDVYSLGAMLYEMLTGEPPHLGNSVQAVVAKILTDHPEPVIKRRDTVPPHVDAALQVALAKLPADRFATAASFAQALGNPGFTHAATRAAAGGLRFGDVARWRRIATGLGVAALILVGVAALGWLRGSGGAAVPVVRFALAPADLGERTAGSGAVSPDGSQIVMGVFGGGGPPQLVQRSLAGIPTQTLSVGYVVSGRPFFSPDGAEMGFIAGPTPGLRVVQAGGGPPRTVYEGVGGGEADWGADGFIYFALPGFALARVSSAGGAVDTLFVPAAGGACCPRLLPGGRGLLFVVGPNAENLSIAVLDLETREHRTLTAGGRASEYVETGHILFSRDRFIMAAAFDLGRMELTGTPTPVAEVSSGAVEWFAYGGGTMAYGGGGQVGGGNRPVLIDRQGRRTQLQNLQTAMAYGYPAVSPDGRKIALRVSAPTAGEEDMDIWVYELPDGPLTRLTFEGRDDDPSWTPDGRRVLFNSNRSGKNSLYWKPWDGSTAAEPVLERDGQLWRTSWLPDGRRFVFYELLPNSTNRDLGLAVVGSPDSTRALFPSPVYNEDWPAVSPDGRWLAYASNESGNSEVYVRPLEGEGTRRQVSRQGGDYAFWGRSGRELFFVARDSVYAAALSVDRDISIRSVRPLFELPCCSTLGVSVFPGDSLFVVFEAASQDQPIEQQPVVIVANFLEELKSKLGGGR
ncbi:MAG TPA: protein kinase [Gemmatimonadales bacterium]|jgi:serine/threonine-protein kinase